MAYSDVSYKRPKSSVTKRLTGKEHVGSASVSGGRPRVWGILWKTPGLESRSRATSNDASSWWRAVSDGHTRASSVFLPEAAGSKMVLAGAELCPYRETGPRGETNAGKRRGAGTVGATSRGDHP